MTKWVEVPDGAHDYLPAGMRLEVLREFEDLFLVEPLEGFSFWARWVDCPHLNGGNWIVDEENAHKEIPSCVLFSKS